MKKKPNKSNQSMPVMPAMCATCPFREGSKHEGLRHDLTISALSECSRICHSTGSNNGINYRTGKPEMLCRGARNMQMDLLVGIGFLSEATDAAWNAKCAEMGMVPNKKWKG